MHLLQFGPQIIPPTLDLFIFIIASQATTQE
jgi:hypothetical protein